MKKKTYLTPELEVISLVSMKETLAAASGASGIGTGGNLSDPLVISPDDLNGLFGISL